MTNNLTLTRPEAAALCGLTPAGFDMWVRKGVVPPPLPGTRRYSRVQIERALAGMPFVPTDAAVQKPVDAYAEWAREHDALSALWPKHDLNKRLETALRFLGRHPGPQPVSVIAGVSNRTMEELIRKGLVAEVPDDDERLFSLTSQGVDEFERYKARDAQR